MDYSNNTLDVADKLLRGESVYTEDIKDPDELKVILSSNNDLIEVASNLFLQGQRVQSSIYFDGVSAKIDPVDVSNDLIDRNGASGVIVTNYPNGEMGAFITFKVGENINPEEPEKQWSANRSGNTLVLSFDNPDNINSYDIEEALTSSLKDMTDNDLMFLKVRFEFGEKFDLDYISPSAMTFRDDPQGTAYELMDILDTGEHPMNSLDWGDDTAEQNPPSSQNSMKLR